jgi:class 3 adenylate cyclase
MRCPSCKAENPDATKFCGNCGQPLMNRCAKCVTENPPQFKFCGECGATLQAGVAAPAQGAARTTSASLVEQTSIEEHEAPEGERKTVTALFADIKGSTELIEDLDPEEARAIIDPALKLMIDAVRRYEGYVVQSTGDGIFALFGAPVAHEDHPQRALYAALGMQEEVRRYADRQRAEGRPPLQIRVGVNTGEVVVRALATGDGKSEYTAIGHTANLAARMQTLANPGSTVIAESTRKLVECYFTLKPLGASRVKGLAEPVNVYEVTGLGPLRTRLQRSAGRGFTKFVGRQREMEAMKRAAEQAKSGHGQIVAAMAEPGVGKSRLYFEFKATSQSGWMVLETVSISHGKASAYLPVLDLLLGYFKIASGDDERTRREKVAGRLAILDRSLEDALPYLLSLLGIVEGNDPLAQMDGQIKKRRTLDAIKRILLRESLNQPLMVIFEDLHWIDEATQELLNLLADSMGTAKILLLVNYRPEYTHQWNNKTYYTQLRLDPLGRESAEEMLTALVGDGIDVRPLKRLIIERIEGNAFFLEEIVQSLFEDGVLHRNGAVKLAKSMNAVKVPTTVQGVIAARIDRLPAEQKELLQTLAVLGREFPLDQVRRVMRKPDDHLNRMLTDLQLAEFIYEQPATGDVEYIFKHALTQEVASNSLLIERRKLLHERTGEALESMFAGYLDDHLGQLAHHYSRSGNPAKALQYLALAAKQAYQRAAYADSQALLQQGLEWINRLPESIDRDSQEFELASTLVLVLTYLKGTSAPEMRAAAERAVALARKGNNPSQFISQLYWTFLAVWQAGDYSGAAAYADQMLDLAQREGSATSLSMAHLAQQDLRYICGDIVGAEEHFQRGNRYREAGGNVLWAPGAATATMAVAAVCASMLGHADSARERQAQIIVVARNGKNPADIAFGRLIEGWLSKLLRDPQRVEVATTQALALSEEHGFPQLANWSRTFFGWARAQLGSASEGVALIHQGLAGLAEAGTRHGITYYLTCLAEAQALDGSIDDAVATIEEALLANPDELSYWPDALKYRGELRLKIGRTELAEADFREAIALAQKMQAKLWELRATTSLARLLASQGKRDEARTMLADIYNWFTEGFDTADLKDAKALLAELRG